MEMSTTARPRLELRVAHIGFLLFHVDPVTRFCVRNADEWAGEGWGGYIEPGAMRILADGMVLSTPKLTRAEDVASMKPFIGFLASLGRVPLDNEVDTA